MLDSETASQLKKPTGMFVELTGGPQAALEELNLTLSSRSEYCQVLGLTQPADATAKSSEEETATETGASTEVKTPEVQTASTPNADITEATGPAPAAGETRSPEAQQQADLQNQRIPKPDESGLSMEWLRTAVTQEEAIREEEKESDIWVPPVAEKKELTPAERERVKPAGDFIMDLTKAMLRTGYYASDHPGCQDAKRGLYQSFQNFMGDSRELMITNQESRDHQSNDILITGILDEPVNVRMLVGTGMAELFIPKLREYFNRKALVSFAIRKDITAEHFENFVDIMSDPAADRGENAQIGSLLSTALIDHGITEISAIFMDDIIVLEMNLPWRVEMAIQRLAKDLTVLPMFRAESTDAIRKMKLQLIEDIIRPLRHPQFLKDLIINCYVIADHVKHIDSEDIEKVLIEAFPLNTLLPTSRLIFDEFDRLRKMKAAHPDNPSVNRRISNVRRNLKLLAIHLSRTDIHGAQRFLEQLYLNNVLRFEELPPSVQYIVNTAIITMDIQAHTRRYVERILQVDNIDDAVVLLKCCRRTIPLLLEEGNFQIPVFLTKAIYKAARETGLFSGNSELPSDPLQFVFKDREPELSKAYESTDESGRKSLGEIVGYLGTQGIELLCKILSESEHREARKAAMNALIEKGDMARRWVLRILDDPEQKWYLKRNALMLLRHVSREDAVIDRARRLVAHSHPKVRDEALNTVVSLKASGAEELVMAALNDPDDKIRWRATKALVELSPLSQNSMNGLLEMIQSELPEEKEAAVEVARKISRLTRAIGIMAGFPNPHQVEETILALVDKYSGQKKGLLHRFKKSGEPDADSILSAAIETLGKIGTARAESLLTEISSGKSPHAEIAQKAANSIRLRLIETYANTPSDAKPS